jgi:hypothetical protein
MGKSYDKVEWLRRLEKVRDDSVDKLEEGGLEHMSLNSALKILAELNPDKEYQICRDIAVHLLASVPEPNDTKLDEE